MHVEWQSPGGLKCQDPSSKSCNVSPVGEIWIIGDGLHADRSPNYAYFRDFQNVNDTFKARVYNSLGDNCEVDKVEFLLGGSVVKTIDTNRNCKNDKILLIPAGEDSWDIDGFRWQ